MSDRTAPIISVIMSVWNGETYLDEAVSSILTQSFTNFEFIIVNDGSTDNTDALLDLCEGRDSRIHVFHHEHQGQVSSLNFASEKSNGKYLFHMDGDDISLPNRFEQQLAFLEEDPEVVLLGSANRMIWPDGRVIMEKKFPKDDASIRAALINNNCFCHSAIAMRKEAFDSVGGYREAFLHAEDWDLWLRLTEKYEAANLEEVLVLYRVHGNQICARDFEQQALSAIGVQTAAKLRAENRNEQFLLQDGKPVSRTILKKASVTDAEIDRRMLSTLDHQLFFALSPERPAGFDHETEIAIARVKDFCNRCEPNVLLPEKFPFIAKVLGIQTKTADSCD